MAMWRALFSLPKQEETAEVMPEPAAWTEDPLEVCITAKRTVEEAVAACLGDWAAEKEAAEDQVPTHTIILAVLVLLMLAMEAARQLFYARGQLGAVFPFDR
jgi:hypothetical protein